MTKQSFDKIFEAKLAELKNSLWSEYVNRFNYGESGENPNTDNNFQPVERRTGEWKRIPVSSDMAREISDRLRGERPPTLSGLLRKAGSLNLDNEIAGTSRPSEPVKGVVSDCDKEPLPTRGELVHAWASEHLLEAIKRRMDAELTHDCGDAALWEDARDAYKKLKKAMHTDCENKGTIDFRLEDAENVIGLAFELASRVVIYADKVSHFHGGGVAGKYSHIKPVESPEPEKQESALTRNGQYRAEWYKALKRHLGISQHELATGRAHVWLDGNRDENPPHQIVNSPIYFVGDQLGLASQTYEALCRHSWQAGVLNWYGEAVLVFVCVHTEFVNGVSTGGTWRGAFLEDRDSIHATTEMQKGVSSLPELIRVARAYWTWWKSQPHGGKS